MAEHAAAVAHQFDDAEQQRGVAELGMWIFLATEVMFFGGMFTAFTAYRWLYPAGFAHASRHLDVLLGGINTVVLIGSSLTMVLAVHGARVGHRRMLLVCLGLTMLLGSVFLGIKAIEWTHKWEDGLVPGLRFTLTGADAGPEELFFCLYFAMTGVHRNATEPPTGIQQRRRSFDTPVRREASRSSSPLQRSAIFARRAALAS